MTKFGAAENERERLRAKFAQRMPTEHPLFKNFKNFKILNFSGSQHLSDFQTFFFKYFMSHQITKLSEATDLGGQAVVKKDFKK